MSAIVKETAASPHVQISGATALETRFLAVDGGQIAYDDTGGNGPLIVAIDRAAIMENLREPGRMAALQAMIGLSKADTAAIVPHSRVPALVVMGTRDPDLPDAAAEARWLASELRAESLIIDGAGHYPHTEMPERVAPTLLSFIAQAHG